MVICIGLSKSALSTYITSKALKIWYTLMDHYLVDIHLLSFGGARIQNNLTLNQQMVPHYLPTWEMVRNYK